MKQPKDNVMVRCKNIKKCKVFGKLKTNVTGELFYLGRVANGKR